MAPLTTPHKDGCRAEHLLRLGDDQACEVAITDLVGALAAGDVTDSTCDLMSSAATLAVLLKKMEEEMEALKAKKRRPLPTTSTAPRDGEHDSKVGTQPCPWHRLAYNRDS